MNQQKVKQLRPLIMEFCSNKGVPVKNRHLIWKRFKREYQNRGDLKHQFSIDKSHEELMENMQKNFDL